MAEGLPPPHIPPKVQNAPRRVCAQTTDAGAGLARNRHRLFLSRVWFSPVCAALLACASLTPEALAAPAAVGAKATNLPENAQSLHLEVFINGDATKLIGNLYRAPDGRFYATRSELKELGIKVPGRGDAAAAVGLETIPGLGLRYEEMAQAMHLELAPFAQLPKEYDARRQTHAAPPDVSPEWGTVLNYNLYATKARAYSDKKHSFTTGALSLDSRVFTPFGIVQNSGIAGTTLTREGFLRLDSSIVFAHQPTATMLKLGDAISGTLPWSRAIRYGGVQINRDFMMRQDLVTAPLPSVAGSAAVPSTVDVYVDNVRIASQDVGAGPFRINNLPLPREAGDAKIVVRDVTGKETVSALPFFTSSRLLTPGQFDYSIDIGAPRYNYALHSFDYGKRVMGMGSLRYGLTDWLTLEAHGEGTRGLANAGLGTTFAFPRLGLFSLAAAFSLADKKTGAQAYASYARSLGALSLSVSSQRSFGHYEDVASVTARDVPTTTGTDWFASGYGLLRQSARVPRALDSVSVAYPFETLHASVALSFVNLETASRDTSRLLGLSWSQTFSRKYNFYINAFKDIAHKERMGAVAGLSFMIGEDVLVNAAGTFTQDARQASLDVMKSMGTSEGDYGWRVYDMEGTHPQRGASAAYRSPWARLDAGLRQDRSTFGGQGEIDGAIVASRGGVFATNRVHDAFAIVDAGAPGVEVLHDNRSVGKTGWRGKMVVTDLHSFQPAKIAINPETVPGDKLANLTEIDVTPGLKSAVNISTNTLSVKDHARVTLRAPDGSLLAPGTGVEHAQTQKTYTIGYDSVVYIPQVTEENTLWIPWKAARCKVQFGIQDRKGARGLVGPLTCVTE